MRGEWSPEVGRGESKHPSLPLARAERKPFDRKKKLPRATSARTCLKKTKPYRKSNLIRATSAHSCLKETKPHGNSALPLRPEK